MTDAPKPLRGFAALSPQRRREIATMGGKAGTGVKGLSAMSPERAAEIRASQPAYTGKRGFSAMSVERAAEIQARGNETRWRKHREKKMLTPPE